jgi:hypothetical protein
MALPKLNTSRYLTTIPSSGKEVEYRPYLVKEEKILMMALETKDQSQILRAVAQVIQECIIDDINVSKLAMFDIEYLFMQLRSKASGEIIDLKLPCELETCKHENNFSVDITKIPVPVSPKIENPISLTDNVSVEMRWPTVSDLQGMTHKQLTSMEGATDMFTKLIVNIFEDEQIHSTINETKADMLAFIDSLNAGQFAKMSNFLGSMPTVETNVNFKCTKCNHETKVELKGLQSFFT